MSTPTEPLRFESFTGAEDSSYWEGARSVRWDVFVIEQEVPRVLEVDARDFAAETVHLVGMDDAGQIVATARVLADSPTAFHLGRVAVRREGRGRGWGAAIVTYAAEAIATRIPRGNVGTITLDAQVQAIGFYEGCGYVMTDRPEFLDAGILHREMDLAVEGRA